MSAAHNIPRISFYMTVKDGEPYLAHSVESILAQDIDDWEAVIVDDGSTDGTAQYLKTASRKDSRIRITLTDGVGRGRALNLAVSKCQASIITNLDSDDLAHPARASFMLRLFHENPTFSIISGTSSIIASHGTPLWSASEEENGTVRDVTGGLANMNPVSHSAVGVRRQALQRVGGYDENRHSQFDYDLWVRLAATGYTIGKTQVQLASKRSHSNQSFERGNHLLYVWRAAEVKWRATTVLKTSRIRTASMIAAHLMWAVVPARARMAARRVFQR